MAGPAPAAPRCRPWRRSPWTAGGGAAAPARSRSAGRRRAACRWLRNAAAGARGPGRSRRAARRRTPPAIPRRWSARDAARGRAGTPAGHPRTDQDGHRAGSRQSPRRRRRAAAAARAGCPCRDGDLPGPPADVVQRQRGDLPGAQPEPGQQRQHREVTAPGDGAPGRSWPAAQRPARAPGPAAAPTAASWRPTARTAPAARRSGPRHA